MPWLDWIIGALVSAVCFVCGYRIGRGLGLYEGRLQGRRGVGRKPHDQEG